MATGHRVAFKGEAKGNDATSPHHSINHVFSCRNASQALPLKTAMHELMLNYLLLLVLDSETHKEWELQTMKQQDIPQQQKASISVSLNYFTPTSC